MPTFKLDGKAIPFEPGETIIQAALAPGIDIPHYCWHPGLSSPANCRMCLVEILPPAGQRPLTLDVLEWDAEHRRLRPQQKPKLQPACYTPAAEGMEVLSDTSEHVERGAPRRAGVSAPEPPRRLPDLRSSRASASCRTTGSSTGSTRSACATSRCTSRRPSSSGRPSSTTPSAASCARAAFASWPRSRRIPVLDMRERGNLNEIVVAPGRQLDGHYTFMTEHVCPVGALTTKDFRFKARVWFLRTRADASARAARRAATRTSTTIRATTRPTATARATTSRSTSSGCATRACSPTRRRTTGASSSASVARRDRVDGQGARRGEDALRRRANDVDRRRPQRAALARGQLGASRARGGASSGSRSVYWPGTPDGYQDDILIHRDKNPNTSGVQSARADGASRFRRSSTTSRRGA